MKKNDRVQDHMTDLLFTIGLFCVFAAAAFILVLIGIQAYQSTVEHMQDTFSTRTAVSYVAEKLRQHDVAGSVELGQVEDYPALVLYDNLGESTYRTYIYSDGQELYELTVRDGVDVTASMGEKIMEVKDFTIADTGDGFYEFSASDSDGRTVRYLTHLRSDG